MYEPGGTSGMEKLPSFRVTAWYGCSAAYTHPSIQPCTSHSIRIIPAFRIGFSIRKPLVGIAWLKTVCLPRKPCVLCMTGSELTTTIDPTGIACTCGSNWQLRLLISGFLGGFAGPFPFWMSFRYTTAPWTPLSLPTVIKGSSRMPPQVSVSFVGMILLVETSPW